MWITVCMFAKTEWISSEHECSDKNKKSGPCIVIKTQIQYCRFNNTETAMENLGVLIEGQNLKMKIYNIHQKPEKYIFFTELNHVLNDSNTLTIVAGDFNSKHSTGIGNIENSNGRKLLKHSRQHGYTLRLNASKHRTIQYIYQTIHSTNHP